MKRTKQALIVLLLCAGIGNSYAVSHSVPEGNVSCEIRQHVERHRDKPHRRGRAMNDQDFTFLYNKVKGKAFDSDKLDLISVGALDNFFTCKQCVRLMSLCTFDDGKLKVLKILAKHIEDREHYNDILRSLTFDSNKDKAADMLGIRREW